MNEHRNSKRELDRELEMARKRVTELEAALKELRGALPLSKSCNEDVSLHDSGLDYVAWQWDVPAGEVFLQPGRIKQGGFINETNRTKISLKEFEELIHHEDLTRLRKMLGNSADGMQSGSYLEIIGHAGSGAWRWVKIASFKNELDDQGRIVNVAGVILRLSELCQTDSEWAAQTLVQNYRMLGQFEDTLEHSSEAIQKAEEFVAEQDQCLVMAREVLKNNESLREVYKERGQNVYQLFKTLAPAGWDCIFMMDSTMKYKYVHPMMAWRLGLPPSEYVGHSEDEFLDGAQELTHPELRQRLLKEGYVHRQVRRVVDGKARFFDEVLVCTVDSQDQLEEIWGISRDATESRIGFQSHGSIKTEPKSKAMSEVYERAARAATQDSLVLLTGESGSGKDYIAKWIHDHSARSQGPFLSINCARITEQTAESQLFGHERGAFTGADSRKRGLIEQAANGTLLLNEIGELPLDLQARLLTFLDERSYQRLGGEQLVRPNVRIMAATNRDLQDMVNAGTFRQDLFFRLNVFHIPVPPLRKRKADIPELVTEMLADKASDFGLKAVPPLDEGVMEDLCDYSWPGNIRELQNSLERGLLVNAGPTIRLLDLFPERATQARPKRARLADSPQTKHSEDHAWLESIDFPHGEGWTYNEVVRDFKLSLIKEALRRTGGNQTQAAKMLGMGTRFALRRQMETLGYTVPK
jgi:transcriptional regulator with PAS, ATPase and Fis domain